jgi:GTP-binding protein Era
MKTISHCGYVAIVGRPNVGKSTLLNRILGQKLSITSHKPQTTRHRILGIKTIGDTQTIYVDTPGLHKNIKYAINRYMNRAATTTLNDVDVIVWVIDGLRWTDEDEWILNKLKKVSQPIILVVNKVDQIKLKTQLLPYLERLSQKIQFTEIIPLSARTGNNLAALEQTISKLLPENPHFFPDDQLTDRSDRFIASEFIREKLTRSLQQELPYASAVEIEEFTKKNNVLHINAVIWVERDTQKAIVIGKDGEQLKGIGSRARLAMEKFFGHKIFLKLWVKVKDSWSDDERALQSLGYVD